MVSWKWQSREVWGVMGIRGVWGGVWYGRDEMKAPPHGNTYEEDLLSHFSGTTFGTDIYLSSLTFSITPDEVASVWRQQKLS